jgi:hypothetical protein
MMRIPQLELNTTGIKVSIESAEGRQLRGDLYHVQQVRTHSIILQLLPMENHAKFHVL